MSDIETLIAMHSYKRPAHSQSEADFIERFITPLGAKFDRDGNAWVLVGRTKPDILWSCHTDTVHISGGTQRLTFDGKTLKLHKKSRSSCLGADCGAGVFLMTEMIKAGKPGLYVFHAEEENGAVGSRAFAKTNAKYLQGFKAAIAFDRRGTDSVISHMGSVRTCSNAFADSLAAQLEGYTRDETGGLTDTKQYRHIIPECTNISVGYDGAHSSVESLDVPHILRLKDQLIRLDTSKLVIERDPASKDEYLSYTGTYYGGYAKNTIKGLVWAQSEATAAVIQSLMSFEEFKTLVEAEQKKLDARWDKAYARYQDKTKAANETTAKNFDAWPDVTGSTSLSTPGSGKAPPPVTQKNVVRLKDGKALT